MRGVGYRAMLGAGTASAQELAEHEMLTLTLVRMRPAHGMYYFSPPSQWALSMQGRSENRTRPAWSAHTKHMGDYCRGLTAHSTLRYARIE